jgi:hypothetical protein
MIAGQAIAADARISSVSGSVLANQNGAMAPASADTSLSTGDRLIARDGSAEVTFADGCVVTLKTNSMLSVGASSPCASGEGLISASEGDVAQTNPVWPSVLTFLAVAAVLVIAADDDDDPVSP